MSSSVVFFDVDAQDQPLVLAHVPGATFFPPALRGEELIAACKDAEIISTFITTPFSREVLLALPHLRLLCTRSVGFDHIDLDTCRERGVIVCNVPDYGSHVIAEHVFALLLSTIRHITEGNRRVAAGIFDYHGLRGMALQGKTLGIVGTGKIGRKVAQIAKGFDMRILAFDVCRVLELEQAGVTYVEMSQLLAESDVLSLHVPSLPSTKGMINRSTLAQMKDGVILVNTARGSLIEDTALLEALDAGKVRYALLDVLEHEANVQEDVRLVQHPHVVTTPHIAFYADDSVRTMYMDCFESIAQWRRGEKPTHVVESVHVVCETKKEGK